jgi:hypothetical protein
MQTPPKPDRELQRLRARQQHADVERLHECLLADPAASVDDLPMHDRDLSGGSTERHEAELQPEAEGFPARGLYQGAAIGEYQGSLLNSAIQALIAG